ncbi:MAG TPA: DUF5996 family protein [Bryobacteraceae bacterium]|jgi:hypothetical protein
MAANPAPARLAELWPALPLDEWKETCATLHMWTQIVGKVRAALSPHVNHWWEVPLYLSACGLSTSPIAQGNRVFEIEFDFIQHNLAIRTSDGLLKFVPLYPRSVADFYREFILTLRFLQIPVQISSTPVEVPDPIPFERDEQHAAYAPEYVNRFWRILLRTDSIFKEFRSRFLGKVSPVHFFWGSFDLAVTRFSGRRAPERPGADPVTREAYSHECSSAGFWPGSGDINGAAFYSYTSPEPAGYGGYKVHPQAAYYHPALREFVVMYDDVRQSASPKEVLLDFLQSTYEAGATLGYWDRESLERSRTR